MNVDESLPPLAPLERYAVIEADQFCTCGYNLHGQRIGRDERLGFMVVRCPECGAWHPAGHGSTATRVWLRRLAGVLLVIWGLGLLAGGLAIAGALVGFHFGVTMSDTVGVMIERSSDRVVQYGNDADGTFGYMYVDTGEFMAANSGVVFEYVEVPRSHPLAAYSTTTWSGPPVFAYVMLWGIPTLLALIAGIVQAVTLWHLRGIARWIIPLVLTLLPYAILLAFTFGVDEFRYLRPMLVQNGGILFGATFALWIIGVVFGRPIGRGLARLLVPPKPRQALAFLWHADGKDVPA